MKKILIHAYAAGNLGDDLLVRLLCQRYPDVGFRLCADRSYHERFRDIKNIKIYAPDDLKTRMINKLIKLVKKQENGIWKFLAKTSFASVHIGGSVFVQHFDDFMPFYNMDADLRRLSKRLCVIGANFGPYTDENYYRMYHELFQSYEGVSFRDKYSYSLFCDLPNVMYAPDVAFNCQREEQTEVKKQVLISVIQIKNRNGKYPIGQYAEDYRNFMADLIKGYVDLDYDIKMVSFCKCQKDDEEIREIIGMLEEFYRERVSVFCYDKDLDACIRLFAESEIIIGTRFHSIIFGWLYGKKVLPVVYDPKTLHTLEDNNCQLYVKLDDLKEIDYRKIISQISEMEEFYPEKLIEESKKQFYALDKILGKRRK